MHIMWYAKRQTRDQSIQRQHIRDIAMSRPQFGYLRVLVMLKHEGWQVGKKRVYRLYRPGRSAAALESNYWLTARYVG